jgi:P-type Ca2+ transporter type 2C
MPPSVTPSTAPTSAPVGAEFAGLTDDEAHARFLAEGPNELPAQQPRSLAATALQVVREPMFLMLVAAGGLYLLMGELADALLLLSFVFVVMAITLVQERRTERALDALRDLSSPRALVVRGGQRRRIAGREVVRGDWVVVSEGDRVPADGMLRAATHLSVDESLLTGEAVPVRKRPAPHGDALDPPGGDDLPSVFSGTLVTAGQGTLEIVATGPRSALGKIGDSLASAEEPPTPLQQETGRIVRRLAIVGVVACGLVIVAYALTRGGGWAVWKQGLLAGIAMAMAILPEEFPVVLTVFLAFGAWRLSRSHVLTRRMPAVETLGAATVLCVDKTGTLTQNRMTLRVLGAARRTLDLQEPGADAAAGLPAELAPLLEHALLASRRDAFDPMDRAITTTAQEHLPAASLHATWQLVREYALSPQLLAVTQAWSTSASDPSGQDAPAERLVLATKGSPEAVAQLCGLSAAERAEVERDVTELASRGMRVLAVAHGELPRDALPAEHGAVPVRWIGLLGFEDPLRPTVPAAMAECQSAGVRVVMITGDYPATAQSIARQAGILRWEAVLCGPELAALPADELARRVGEVQVFARVVPEQKLLIVNALKANGEVVAMTGDGVNDAPALKAAHIGIAMGGRGTDVAREAAALVLLNDDFASIVTAIRLGRRIFDNLRKAITFIVAVHVPIAGLSMVPVFFADWPLLLLPVHIVFLELIIDPACSLVFEAEAAEEDVMRRPPRSRSEGLFARATVVSALWQGASILAICLGVFVLARPGHGVDAARTLTFVTMVVAFLVVILVNRSATHSIITTLRAPNRALRWLLLGTPSLLAIAVLLPIGRRIFRFAPLHASDAALCLAAGVASVCGSSWSRRCAEDGRAPPPRRDRVRIRVRPLRRWRRHYRGGRTMNDAIAQRRAEAARRRGRTPSPPRTARSSSAAPDEAGAALQPPATVSGASSPPAPSPLPVPGPPCLAIETTTRSVATVP